MAKTPRYRDLAAPYQPDTTILETGGVEAAASLARALKEFEGLGNRVAGTLREQQGAREGAAAGLTAAFQPRRGLAATTRYGQAYNAAGAAAFMARSTSDIEANLDRLEQDHQGDPEGFAAKAEAFASGLLKESPVDFHPRLQQLIAERTAAAVTRLRGQQLEEIRSAEIAAYERGATAAVKLALDSLRDEGINGDTTIAAAIQDNDAQLAALVKDRVITPLQAERYRQKFAEQLDASLAGAKLAAEVGNLMALARGDVEAGDRALVALQDRTDLDEHDRIVIAEEYRRQRGLLEFERSRQYVNETAQLAQRLAAGEHGVELEGVARRLYRLGAISPDEFESVLEQSARNQQRAVEEGADIATVQASLQLGRGVDPADPKQRKALTKMFDAETARLGESPGSDRWQAHAVELARSTGVLPESAESWARINLTSGDPAAAAVAASFLKRVADANPVAAAYNSDPKLAALVEKMTANMSAGLPPEKAYRLAMQSTYLLTDAQRKELNERYRVDKVARGNEEALDDLLSGDDQFDPSVFTSVPDVPIALRAEFNGLVEQYYAATGGNVEQARALAYKAIKSTWGLSNVNGRRELMKWAPERLGIPTEVIRRDIAESVKPLGLDPSKVKLVPNASTDRTRGVIWSLAYENEFGAVDVVLGPDNRPLVYQLPVGASFHKTREAIKAQKLEEARRQREFELENAETATDLERRLLEYQRAHPNDMTLRR